MPPLPVSLPKRAPLNFRKQLLDFEGAFGYFKHLAIDVYILEPILATFLILNERWSGLQSADNQGSSTMLPVFESLILSAHEVSLLSRPSGEKDKMYITHHLGSSYPLEIILQ